MKKYFFLALAAASGLMLASCAKEYDDSALKQDITDLQDRVSALEQITKALQENDYVTTFKDNGDGSYTLTFAKSGDVTIRNGKDGVNGENGDSFFSAVTSDGSYVNVTLSDGTSLALPMFPAICSIVYIPDYTDGKVTVPYDANGGDYYANNIVLNFEVYPEQAASQIKQENASVRIIYTNTRAEDGSDAVAKIEKLAVASNKMRLTLNLSSINQDFFNGKSGASIALDIKVGNSTVSSGYIALHAEEAKSLTAIKNSGYTNVTAEFTSTPGVTVWKAEGVNNMPVLPTLDGSPYRESVYSWFYNVEYRTHYVFQEASIVSKGVNDGTWARGSQEGLSSIVIIDPTLLTGRIAYDTTAGEVVVKNGGSLINIAGTPKNLPAFVYADGTYQLGTVFPIGDITEKGSEGTSSSIGFLKDGSVQLGLSHNDGGIKKLDKDILWEDENEFKYATKSAWDVNYAVSVTPWMYRSGLDGSGVDHPEGYAMDAWSMSCTDPTHWEPMYGQCWAVLKPRTFVGITNDGKIGFATFENAATYCAGTFLNRLGWKDVAQVGTAAVADETCGIADTPYTPTIIIDGKVLVGSEDATALYSFGFDPKNDQ